MLRRLTTCLTALSLLLVSFAPLNVRAAAASAAGAKARKKSRSKVAPEFVGAAAQE
jgi:hypothetical protein